MRRARARGRVVHLLPPRPSRRRRRARHGQTRDTLCIIVYDALCIMTERGTQTTTTVQRLSRSTSTILLTVRAPHPPSVF